MKYYGLKHNRLLEKLRYNVLKIYALIYSHLTLGKKRKGRIINYNLTFKNRDSLDDKYDYTISKDKYYLPFSMVVTELVAKEDISKLQHGLKRMIENLMSHKFLGGEPRSINEIINIINRMDESLSDSAGWMRVGTFDFTINNFLNSKFDNFSIKIITVNSSYIGIQFLFEYTDIFIKELRSIIDSNYHEETGYLSKIYTRNHKKSGALRTFTSTWYNGASLKSDKLNEMLVEAKWKVMKYLSKFLPLYLTKLNLNPIATIVYKTNCDIEDPDLRDFVNSVGLDFMYSKPIDKYCNYFFAVQLSSRYENIRTDMILIVNDQKIKREEMFYRVELQIEYTFLDGFYNSYFKYPILQTLSDYCKAVISVYFKKINQVKFKHRKLKKLLKLQYEYERDIEPYLQYIKMIDWADYIQKFNETFDNEIIKEEHCKNWLVGGHIVAQQRIINQNIASLRKDIDDKIKIHSYKKEYTSAIINSRLNALAVLISAITLWLVIFPGKATTIAKSFENLWNNLIFRVV